MAQTGTGERQAKRAAKPTAKPTKRTDEEGREIYATGRELAGQTISVGESPLRREHENQPSDEDQQAATLLEDLNATLDRIDATRAQYRPVLDALLADLGVKA